MTDSAAAKPLPDTRPDAAPLALWLRVPAALSYGGLRRVAAGLAWLLRVVVRFRVSVVRRNLRRCFPQMTDQQLQATVAQHYREMTEAGLEMFKLVDISADELRARVKLHNASAAVNELAAGHPVMVLSAHLGNWEWLLQRMAIEFDVPFVVAYKPLRNARFDRQLQALRSRFGAHLVSAKGLIRHILRNRQPHVVGMLADQMPVSSPSRLWVEFFGQPTAFYPGPGEIAQRVGYSAFFLAMRRVSPSRYEVDVQPVAMAAESVDAREFTRRYAACVEAQLRRHPSDWAWGHRRWKLPAPTTPA
jgi:KDO2-lipid IV(A) lauroyltransferase